MCKLTTSRILATALFISNLLHGVRAWTSITTKTAITTTITTTTRTPRSLLSRHGARPSRPASSLPASLSSNLVDSSTATTSIADISNNNIVDWDWQSLASSAFIDTDTRPILLFDGVCNFCNAGVNLAIDLDMTDQGAIRFCSLQSKTGQSLLLQHGKHANDLSSVVLVESLDTAYVESEAVLRTTEWTARVGQTHGRTRSQGLAGVCPQRSVPCSGAESLHLWRTRDGVVSI
jgi:hypothetical protein